MLTLSGDHPSLHGLAPDAPPELCDVIESLLRPGRSAGSVERWRACCSSRALSLQAPQSR
jgi:hypothetical protein